MIPDYIDVMLGLLRRDAKNIGDQWRMLSGLLDGTLQRGLGLDSLPRPQRDLLVRSLSEQVAIGLERLCGPSVPDGLSLATLVEALKREEASLGWPDMWSETCEVPVLLWEPLHERFTNTVRRLAYEDPIELEDLLFAHVPRQLGAIKNALDALAGAFLSAAAA